MNHAKLLIAVTAVREGLESIEHVLKNTQSGDVVDGEINALLEGLETSLHDARTEAAS